MQTTLPSVINLAYTSKTIGAFTTMMTPYLNDYMNKTSAVVDLGDASIC